MRVARALCILLLGLPAISGSLSSTVDDTLREYEDECIRVTGSDANLVEQTRKPRKIPDDGNLDAFAICMLKKFNVMSKDGSVNSNSHAYKIFSDSVYIYEISDRCKVMRGKTTGETARKIMNCYLDSNELVMAILPRKTNDTMMN